MNFEMESCGVCRTCEMMCCFHHTGTFGYVPTSFQVKDNPGGKGYLIMIAESDEGEFVSCDACGELETPLCVEVCKEGDLLLEHIKKINAKQMEITQAAER